MVWFHTIRGIAVKHWAASVIYFVANFHHFVEKNKIKIILSEVPFFKKIPITETIIKKFAKNHHNWLQCESCLRFFYSHVLITNLTKYSYRRLQLEQHYNTATYSNLLTNILIMTEMEANWDLNLLASPLDRRLSISVGFGHKLLALNSLNKVVHKIILNLHLSVSLILPTHNKVLHKSNPHFRPQFEPHPTHLSSPFFLKLSHKIHQSKNHSPKIRMNTLK
jgi:hypothetical protein